MAAHENLNNYQFRYRPTGPQKEWDGYFSDFEEDDGYTLYDHEVNVVHKPTRQNVAYMLYHTDGPIFQIHVDREHQRQGIATHMVKHATEISKASKTPSGHYRIPYPQRAYNETEEGEAWADSMEKRGFWSND
jgi:ribosomal protein S18 acetylase RimI-like enzyme